MGLSPGDLPASAPAGVLVVGSLNADLAVYASRLPGPGETVAGRELVVSPGGKSANQAAAAGRLGASVRLLGAVGDDEYARMLLNALRGAGVDTSTVLQLDGQTSGVAVIEVDDRGENSIVVVPGANGVLSADRIDAAAPAFAAAAVVSLGLEVPMGTVLAAARAGHQAGATVLLNPSPYQPLSTELLDCVDVLVLNAHEAADLLGLPDPGADWTAAAQAFAERGLTQVVVTLGGDGAVVLQSGQQAGGQAAVSVTPIAPMPVRVVDTTGCGDAFTGALAVGLAARQSLIEAAQRAAVVGALAATKRGAQSSYPTAVEVAAHLTEGR